MKLLVKIECPHHGLQYVSNKMRCGAVVHDVLACGCTAESIDGDFFKEGDVVLWDEELYLVQSTSMGFVDLRNVHGLASVPLEEVEYVGEDTISGLTRKRALGIGNSVRHTMLGIEGVISGHQSVVQGTWRILVPTSDSAEPKQYVWREEDMELTRRPVASPYYASAGRRHLKPSPKRDRWDSVSAPEPKPKKALSISTADLLKEEIQELSKSDTRIPVPIKPKKKIDTSELEPVKIKKRKGTW